MLRLLGVSGANLKLSAQILTFLFADDSSTRTQLPDVRRQFSVFLVKTVLLEKLTEGHW